MGCAEGGWHGPLISLLHRLARLTSSGRDAAGRASRHGSLAPRMDRATSASTSPERDHGGARLADRGTYGRARRVSSRARDAARHRVAVNDLPPQPAAATQARRWLGFPKGAWLIIGVEFWERFSFYGMLSILALFLTASPSSGGFGWSAGESLALLGAYTFAMYAFPAVGGYIADRVLGRRRAVAIGATFMLVGQTLLSSPVFFPEMLGWLHGAPLLQALRGLGVPLGRWVGSSAVQGAISSQGPSLDAHAGVAWLEQAYAASSF